MNMSKLHQFKVKLLHHIYVNIYKTLVTQNLIYSRMSAQIKKTNANIYFFAKISKHFLYYKI